MRGIVSASRSPGPRFTAPALVEARRPWYFWVARAARMATFAHLARVLREAPFLPRGRGLGVAGANPPPGFGWAVVGGPNPQKPPLVSESPIFAPGRPRHKNPTRQQCSQ